MLPLLPGWASRWIGRQWPTLPFIRYAPVAPVRTEFPGKMTFTAMRTVVSRRLVFVAALTSFSFAANAAQAGQTPGFDAEIRPLLQAKCWSCHSDVSPQAGLNLRTSDSILKGGKSGPALKPGSSAASLLIEKVV